MWPVPSGGQIGVMLFIQALPLFALVALLATGRAGPFLSCVAAMALALPAAWLHVGGGGMAAFLSGSLAQGLWLAVIPVGIISGGLVFHAAVSHRATARPQPTPVAPAHRLFTAAFLLGPFAEAVTGFGVGTVFAIGAVRAAGVAGASAAAIGLMAQTIIPWGGLGPGTAIGAALAGIDPQDLATRNAWLLAPTLLLLLPLFWWWCARDGVRVAWATRLSQIVWVAAVGSLLVLGHQILPWQLCGLLATGTVLSVRLLAANPPRSWADWRRISEAAGPYLLLTGLLLASQLWAHPPFMRPFNDLPALPLNHAMVSIWLAAGIMTLLGGHGARFVGTALARARRPAIALLGFVVLARVLSNAGVPVALAHALVEGLGKAAPFASPVLAVVSGFFAGTNVGGNAAMMPLQAALGRAAGLGATVLPAVQNGTLALVISPQLIAVAAGLVGGKVTPAAIWRIMWPVAGIALLVGIASIMIG